MDIALVIILSIIKDFNNPEPDKYDCDMYYTGIFPKKTQSLTIVLKDKAIMQQEVTRNRSLVHLQCPHGQGFVQINVIISEKVHQSKSKITYLLQNLKLIIDQSEEDCATKCCLSLGEPKRNFQNQTEVSLTLKVLLSGVSACTTITNQTEIFAERELATNETSDTKPPGISVEQEDRRKKAVLIKILIICSLLPIVLGIIVFVIFEVPFPCSCSDSRMWRNIQKRVAGTKKKKARKKKKEATSPEASGTTSTVCHSLAKYNLVMFIPRVGSETPGASMQCTECHPFIQPCPKEKGRGRAVVPNLEYKFLQEHSLVLLLKKELNNKSEKAVLE